MPRHHVRAAQEREDHERAQSRQQKPVVEVRVVDAREGKDETQIEVHEVDHRQEIVVRAGVLDARHIRVLFWIRRRIHIWRGGTQGFLSDGVKRFRSSSMRRRYRNSSGFAGIRKADTREIAALFSLVL